MIFEASEHQKHLFSLELSANFRSSVKNASGAAKSALGAYRSALEALLGGSWRLLGTLLAALNASLGQCLRLLAPPWALPGRSWRLLGRLWLASAAPKPLPDAFLALFGPAAAALGRSPGPFSGRLGRRQASNNARRTWDFRRSVPRRLAAMLGATLLEEAQLEISTATDSKSIYIYRSTNQ